VTIDYRNTHDVDLFQLARLFESAGWHHRTKDFARLSQLVRGSMFVEHAWHGERLVGFARAISDGASNAYVSTVAVLPAYRARGIGRELVARLLQGREHLLFVLHADPRVHAFYSKCGFEAAPDMLKRPRRY
jgi:ribosomal protein S18 acetylase RimI-like enzyme